MLTSEQRQEYNARGDLLRTVSGDQNDPLSVRETITDAAGNPLESAVLEPDGGGGFQQVTRTFAVFDMAGRQTLSEDALGNVVEYDYNAAGQVTLREVWTDDATPVLVSRDEYEYNKNGQLIKHARGDDNEPAEYAYTTYQYDALGNVTKTEVWELSGGTPQRVRVEESVYDEAGRLIKTAHGDSGDTARYSYSEYEYAATYLVVETVFSGDDTEAAKTEQTYDKAGRLEQTIVGDKDVLTEHNKTKYFYAGWNLVEQETKAGTGAVLHQERHTYDLTGRVTQTIIGDPTDQDGHRKITYDYHSDGNISGSTVLQQVWQPDGQGGYEEVSRSRSNYDRAGRMNRSEAGDDSDPNQHSYTTYRYNGAGQVIEQETFGGGASAGASTTTMDAAGRLWKQTDALGRVTEYGYDAAGRRTLQTLALGTTAEATTDYELDLLGRVKKLTDANDNETTFTYNGADQQTSMTDPHGETVAKTYDLRGMLSSVTDRNGRTREFLYDGVGRLIQETWKEGTTVVDTATYQYDLMGRLEMASNANGAYDFDYDALGRITHVEGPFSVWLEFTYDDQGNRTLVEDSFLGSETSTYDGAQRLLSRAFTQTGGPTLRVDQEFDLAGRLTDQIRYNSTTQVGTSTFGHDGAGRITALDHLDANDDPMVEYVFTYDGAGQLLSQSDHGDLREYTYDDQGQLTDDDQGNAFDYDALGNREGADYEYDLVHQNQLTSDGVWDYSYDDEGNLRKKVKILDGDPDEDKTWIYGYDHKNQLISAELWELDPDYYNPGPTGPAVLRDVEYKYDVFGSRIEKSVDMDGEGQDPAEVTRYAIDRWNPAKPAPIGNENADVWAELNADGTLKTRYIRSDVVDQLFAHLDGSDAFWYLPDHLGSVRDIGNASGDIVNTITYDGFGNIMTEEHPEYGSSYKFAGREFDVETGLYYNRARYYDPVTARWISQDPIGFDAGDSNLYRYVNNRPTVESDPSGLDYTYADADHKVWWVVQSPGILWGGNYVDKIHIGWRAAEDRTPHTGAGPAPARSQQPPTVALLPDFGGGLIDEQALDELARSIWNTQGFSKPTRVDLIPSSQRPRAIASLIDGKRGLMNTEREIAAKDREAEREVQRKKDEYLEGVRTGRIPTITPKFADPIIDGGSYHRQVAENEARGTANPIVMPRKTYLEAWGAPGGVFDMLMIAGGGLAGIPGLGPQRTGGQGPIYIPPYMKDTRTPLAPGAPAEGGVLPPLIPPGTGSAAIIRPGPNSPVPGPGGARPAPQTPLPTRAPHASTGRPPQSPLSRPFSTNLEPGTYVYVQDANGVVRVVPNAPGAHPTVLGGGQSAAAAGELTVGPGGVITELNNISYTFQFGGDVLPQVAAALQREGATIAQNAIRPFTH